MTARRLTCRVLSVLALVIGVAPPAIAGDGRPTPARGCGAGVLRGPYTFSFSGVVVSPPFPGIPAGPFAAVGRVVFNGHGEFASDITQSFNGLVLPPAFTTGSYEIDANCTGTAIDSNGGSYYFVVSQRGRNIAFILTNPGVVATGTAKTQN